MKEFDRKNEIRKKRIQLLVLIMIGALACTWDVMADNPNTPDNATIRIAIFQMAPEVGNFTANHATIEKAIDVSSEQEADWFITPELAESGYEFTDYVRPDQLPEFPSPWFKTLGEISRDKNITLFIGFPERLRSTYYNAVAVIDRDGNLSGIYQKNDIIPSKNENWATLGNARTLEVDGHTVGYYICADVVNQSITNTYIANDVKIMLSSAAWYPDPRMGPEEYWENVTAISGVPLVIANTVGKKGKIDFTHADSGVYQDGKPVYLVPESEQVIAFVDWNYLTGEIAPAEKAERV